MVKLFPLGHSYFSFPTLGPQFLFTVAGDSHFSNLFLVPSKDGQKYLISQKALVS